MSEPGSFAVQLSGVSHLYGETKALDTVSLQLSAGRTMGLIGPDGVGKSTLLSLVAGACEIQAGRVEVLGGNMGHSRHRRRVCPKIAYMPQGLGKNLYRDLTVRENLEFFGRLFGQDHAERMARTDQLLHRTGLAPFGDRPAGKLSGGMKQKLGLCCALIHDPDLLILDEPTTGIDPLSRIQFWNLIEHMRARHPRMGVLVATAYYDEAERFDDLVAMHGGSVLASGSPGDIKKRAETESLEAAFIALLPTHARQGHRTLRIPPRQSHDGPPAIVAEGLTRRFGDFTAVDNVSFDIERGEIFGFLGSNGCGKTTTMKVLTGLLPASSGKALLFGTEVDAKAIETRKRVGYMSQSFSLYSELTVRQNLDLHARLFHLPRASIPARIEDLISRFGLSEFSDTLAEELPLGVRQRLSLAVAIIHEPETLILDEPTSGVDPIARDAFWALLIDLSRDQGVTIFISTHFMNEAERCDRVSLMHAGRVLASGAPEALSTACGADNLEEAFVHYLQQEQPDTGSDAPTDAAPIRRARQSAAGLSARRILAYSRREALETYRDSIRMGFALLGTALLMIVFGYGITFDVEGLRYAVLDRDQTPQSRTYLEALAGSRYFEAGTPIRSYAELERQLKSGAITLAIEIPPDFGRKLLRGQSPEIGAWVDGAMPFRGETVGGYLAGLHRQFLTERIARNPKSAPEPSIFTIEQRYRYNQDFKSIYAMVPATIALLLIQIPAILMALGVVREKELGSITNLYVTPITRWEFVVGKQLPYVAVAMANFAILVAMAVFLFGVPVKGSLTALTAGAFLYVITTTGIGFVISTFTRTQIAALFGTAIATIIPAVLFSGMMQPVSSLEGGAALIGRIFPSTYFMTISLGVFTKGLGFLDLRNEFLILTLCIVVLVSLSVLLLRKQAR